jgi:C4-dicarboxylate transporter, DctM subunit
MSPQLIGGIGVCGLFFLLLFRVPIWAALILAGLLGNVALIGVGPALATLGTIPFDTASLYGLSVIPLFILTGSIAAGTGLSAELFKAARVILSGVRGGLSLATIGASACFGAVCGSSIATAATMTRIALQEMRSAGYGDALSTGSIAAGGSLGILFPPSIILVIYGAIAEQSVPKLFAAGLIPGLVLTALYMIVALVVARVRPGDAPAVESAGIRRRLSALTGPWQFMALFIVTIGGIYAGIFSPTEAASIGAFGAITLGVVRRALPTHELVSAIESAVITSSTLFMIIIGANVFSNFMVQTQLPALLAGAASSLALPRTMVMVAIIVIYIIMGCFLEGIGMMLITVPVFLPLIKQYGYDPVWFSIIVVIVIEVGLIHPPVGMNLFVIQAQAPEIRITRIYQGIVPFLTAPLIMIVLMFLFPQLALWLPHTLYR